MKYTKLLFPVMMLVASGAVLAATVEGTDMSFDELDQDGDGVITRDEAEATPALGESFDTLDANADGVLDESEVGVGGPGTGEGTGTSKSSAGEGEMGEGEAPASDDSIEAD